MINKPTSLQPFIQKAPQSNPDKTISIALNSIWLRTPWPTFLLNKTFYLINSRGNPRPQETQRPAHFTREIDRMWRGAELGISERMRRKMERQRAKCGSSEERA